MSANPPVWVTQVPLVPLTPRNPISETRQLATQIGFRTAKTLTYFGRNKNENYETLRIRKKNGKSRIIHNPSKLARVVQYRLLTKFLNNVEIPEYIHAFEKGRAIPAMAAKHVGQGVVISVDIENFFPSIKQALIKRIAVESLGLASTPASVFSEVVTYRYYVPQGALTSPKVANIVTAATFGPVLKQYCDEHGLTLSIYADDVTISGPSDTDVKAVLSTVRNAIGTYGFKVNRDKTKVMRRSNRQYVCGAVVNDKVNLPKRERRKLRAIVHNIVKNGLESEAAKTDQHPGSFLAHVQGRLNWFKQLNPTGAEQLILQLKNLPSSETLQTYPSISGQEVEETVVHTTAPF